MSKISDFGEFNLINLIAREITIGDEVIKGIGDDTAILQLTPGSRLLASSDMLVEGRHFLLEKISAHQLGHKALAVNISDVAAMGGIPKFILISAGWPDYINVEFIQEFYAGVRELAQKHQISIVGGDTVSSPQVVIDITILGETFGNKAILRSGARPGNLLAVTGTIGDSAAGLAYFLHADEDNSKNITSNLEKCTTSIDYVVNRHLLPEPRVKAGQTLLSLGATAMMDISDGLASEVNHICRQSGVGGTIELAKVPLSDAIFKVATLLGRNPWDWALYGGEDYELLAAVPREQFDLIKNTLAQQGLTLTVIGEVTAETGKIIQIDRHNRNKPLIDKGYNHFSVLKGDKDE